MIIILHYYNVYITKCYNSALVLYIAPFKVCTENIKITYAHVVNIYSEPENFLVWDEGFLFPILLLVANEYDLISLNTTTLLIEYLSF